MTDPYFGEAGEPVYRGPPPMQPQAPAGPAQPQPPSSYPYGYPPADPHGYPPVYPYRYPGVAVGDRRPGTLTGAAVLGYVAGGLLIVAAIVVFVGASTVSDLEHEYDTTTSFSVEFAVAAVLNLVSAGLLIGGAVSMTGRNATGRIVYCAGAALVLVSTVYWLARWATKTGLEALVFYGLLFAALAIVGTCLAFTADGTRWLTTR